MRMASKRARTRGRRALALGWVACCWALAACSSDADPMSGTADVNAGTGPITGGGAAMGGMSGGAAGTSGGTAGSSGAGASGAGAGGGGAGGSIPDGGSGTGSDDPDALADAGGAAGSRGSGPGDWGPGDYPPDLTSSNWLEITGVPGQKDYTRQYKVHVPASYDASTPTPLVFCLHGLGQDGLLFCVTGTAMDKKSDEAGFIMVMPNGYQNSWNAGTCCGGASTEQLDDVALIRAIFDEVKGHVNVDLDRVYATGLSNGGYLSYRLACEASDIFTAVAPVAGAIGINAIGGGTNFESDFTECAFSRPVSILDTHGTSDPLIAYALQEPTLELAAMNNGCGTTTKPATVPMGGGDTTCVTYEGCPSGIELTACSIQDGGHCWFGSADCGTGGGDIGLAIVGNNSDTMDNTDMGWEFLKRLAR